MLMVAADPRVARNLTTPLLCHNYTSTNPNNTDETVVVGSNQNTGTSKSDYYSGCCCCCCCCARIVSSLENPYFPYGRDVPTLDDRLSPVDIEIVSDFRHATNDMPAQFRSRFVDLNSSNLPCLMDGAVIFVLLGNVRDWIRDTLPKIVTKFVLVTGDSDGSMPHEISEDNLQSLLKDDRLLHLYAENCDRNPDPKRFTCLPKGVSHWDGHREKIHAAYERGLGLQGLYVDYQSPPKNITLLASFNRVHTEDRQRLWRMACEAGGLLYNRALCDYGSKDHQSLYDQLSVTKFVLSPHGYGLDCYRTYEALYMGAIPVVKKSSLDEVYKDLPVLIVDDWEALAEDGFLERKYQEITDPKIVYRWEKLYKGYWFAKFRSHYPAFYQYFTSVNESRKFT